MEIDVSADVIPPSAASQSVLSIFEICPPILSIVFAFRCCCWGWDFMGKFELSSSTGIVTMCRLFANEYIFLLWISLLMSKKGRYKIVLVVKDPRWHRTVNGMRTLYHPKKRKVRNLLNRKFIPDWKFTCWIRCIWRGRNSRSVVFSVFNWLYHGPDFIALTLQSKIQRRFDRTHLVLWCLRWYFRNRLTKILPRFDFFSPSVSLPSWLSTDDIYPSPVLSQVMGQQSLSFVCTLPHRQQWSAQTY